MKGLFCKLFNIYPGEEKLAASLALLGFLWTLAVTSGLKNADALFLLQVGSEQLPTTYGLIASIMIVLASFLLWAFHTFETATIFYTLLSCAIAFYSFIFVCMDFGIGLQSQWLWFCLRVFGYVFFSVMVTCYWTFIDQFYQLQDAKRLYCLFTSSNFLGVAATGAIMRTGLIDFQNLTLIIAALLTICLFLVKRIGHIAQPVHDENSIQESSAQTEFTFKQTVKAIIESRFSLLLMCGNFILFILMVLTEYNYLATFDKYFDPGTHAYALESQNAELTRFLGQCTAAVSISNLFFGLFIYSRWVRRFGISSILPLTPIILIFTYLGWITSDSLIFAVMGFFVVEGTLFVVDDSNFNLLLNAVPAKLKYKIRITIESFFEPVGMLLSSILLSVAPIDSKTLGLILSCAALIIALLLGSRYVKAIWRNLSENSIHFDKTPWQWYLALSRKQKKNTYTKLLTILNEQSNGRLMAIEALLAFYDNVNLDDLFNAAMKLPHKQQLTFLTLLMESSFATHAGVLDKLLSMQQKSSDIKIKNAITFYFAQTGLTHPDKASKDLKSHDLTKRGAAILALKNSSAYLPTAEAAKNRITVIQELQKLLAANDSHSVAMGLKLIGTDGAASDTDLLIPFIHHPSIDVCRQAIKSFEMIANDESFPHAKTLIQSLSQHSDNEYRLSCIRSLGKIGDSTLVNDIILASLHFRPNERRAAEMTIVSMGLRCVPSLLRLVKDRQIPDRCRLLAGKTLARLALPQLRANLYGIIQHEIERAYFYHYHSCALADNYNQIDLKPLKNALSSSYHSVLDFIIQLLGLAGEIEDCELLARSLRSRNPKIRGQVVETLEKSCERKIFLMLNPLVSDLPVSEKMRAYYQGDRKLMPLEAVLDVLSNSSSQLDQIMGATFKQKLNIPNWRETLRRQMASKEEIFHHFAFELLEA